MPLAFLLFGVVFGWTLSRSGAADYDFIQGMFLFTELQLYGIIGVGVAVALPGILWAKRRGRALDGSPLSIKPKPRHRGNMIGGIIFGQGLSAAGALEGFGLGGDAVGSAVGGLVLALVVGFFRKSG